MRDPKEWAESLEPASFVDDPSGWQTGEIAALIREAQEDGAKEWRARSETLTDDNMSMAAEIVALTERAEKAEREANEWHELLAETSSKLDDAEYERDEAVKALDAHKQRADRAESELHRRKF